MQMYLVQFLSFMVSSKIQECFGRHHDRHNGSRCQREAALDPQDLLGVAGVALQAQRTQFVPSKNKRSMSHSGCSALVGPSTAHTRYIRRLR